MLGVREIGKCTRFLDAHAECVFQPHAPRQRRKKTDARVTHLEKELHHVKSVLSKFSDLSTSPKSSLTPFPSSEAPATRSNTSLLSKQNSGPGTAVSDDLAKELLREFKDFLLPQYPIDEISEPFDVLRTAKPLLFMAAITAASSTREPSLFSALHARLVLQVTDKAIIINGKRSVELIQSMLILGSWYCPPDDLEHLNFYQWFHIASTMASQLGLGGAISQQIPDLSVRHLEGWQTMLSVFQFCSSVAMSMQCSLASGCPQSL